LDRIAIFPPATEQTTGLPAPLKVGVEALAGLALDDVQVHYHSSKPAQVQARAYTQGAHIYVGPGQEQHVPHEAWHVVQQKQGRVRPTMQRQGIAMNDEPTLEREATTVGREVMQGRPLHGRGTNVVLRSVYNRGPIQRIKIGEEEQLGLPPPLPSVPSKFVQPPPLPKKPPAIKVAKVLFPLKAAEPREYFSNMTPEDNINVAVQYATRGLIDALYTISTHNVDSENVRWAFTQLSAYAEVLDQALDSAQRVFEGPEVQQQIDALRQPLPRLRQLADLPLDVVAEKWSGIRAECASTLPFFMTKVGVY